MENQLVPIVLLTPIPIEALDLLKKRINRIETTEIWLLDQNEEIIKWAKINRLISILLHKENNVEISTPLNDVKLALPKEFLSVNQCIFVYINEISSDNYLMGAIYNLSSLLYQPENNYGGMDKMIFELYQFFSTSTFACFSVPNNDFNIQNGWSLDAGIISRKKLNASGFYKLFFSCLIAENIEISDVKIKNSKKCLYSSRVKIKLLIENLWLPFSKITIALIILTNMIAFKWRRYNKKRSTK